MTTPYLPQGRIERKATQLNIDLNRATDRDLLRLYLETVKGIKDELFEENLAPIASTKSFLGVLEKDLREIIKKLQAIKQAVDALNYLNKAYVDLTLALSLFDDVEEPDAVKRIHNRLIAVTNLRQNLGYAISLWPGIEKKL